MYGSSTLKFGTNAIKRMQLLNNGTLDLLTNNLITTGNINAQTGTLIANNLAAYNSGVIVCGHALSVILGLINLITAVTGI